jgi:hypothetical protein
MENTFMMTLDHVGDREAMVYAQLGQQPLARTTETPLELNLGTLSCLSARPPDLADAAGTRPRVVSMFLSTVPFLYSKRTAAARSPGSLIEKRTFCGRFVCTSRGTTPHLGVSLVRTRSTLTTVVLRFSLSRCVFYLSGARTGAACLSSLVVALVLCVSWNRERPFFALLL